MVRFHFSLCLSKIPLCINTTFSWSIHQKWGILVVSITWLSTSTVTCCTSSFTWLLETHFFLFLLFVFHVRQILLEI
jgi:hypothetical protein